MIFRLLWLLSLLIIIPLLLGNSFLRWNRMKESIKLGYIYGWLLLLAIFEIVVIPVTFLGGSLTILTWIYSGVVLGLTAVLFMGCWVKGTLVSKRMKAEWDIRKINFYGVFSICLLVIQIIVAIFCVHMDADDAYYIGTANTSLTTDTLFAIEPDTGIPYQAIPLRYVFAALMIFWAYLGKVTGIHPLIIAHSVIPALFILISYALWWEVGKRLFHTKDQKWIFFLIMNLLNIFGNTSVYTQSSFLLFRIWQGKAMLPNVILPALLLNFLELYEHQEKKRNWLLIFIIIVAGCCCSSMAVPLGTMVVVSVSLVLTIRSKEWKTLLLGAICCIPCAVIGLAYILLQ